jgi:TolA-binding protein
LKIGQIYTKLHDKEKARMMYERILDQYPDMAEAEVARRALEPAGPKNEMVSAD